MASKKATKTTGVLDYLQKCLSHEALFELYTDESRGSFVCRAILQQLSMPAQQVVMRLICTGGDFPLEKVSQWGHSIDRVLKELQKWAIIDAAKLASVVALTPGFARGLTKSLQVLDQSPWMALSADQIREIEKEANEPPRNITIEDLEQYTQAQWDSVLHFLVGSVSEREPPRAVVQFLLQTNLMQPDPDYRGNVDDAPLVITQKGYDFMLSDTTLQVWHFVVQYLASLASHAKGKELHREALLLLICLSFGRVGEAYLTSTSLTKDARVMVKDLHHFGLLFTRKIGKQTIFYPTRVALQLVSSPEAANTAASAQWSLSSKALDAALAHPKPQDSSHLGIIVQTNFQVCAYTTSELHVSMLSLFCDVSTIRRLPNVVFMVITRDSIKGAFALGVNARQIIRFLEKHAHPKLRTTNKSASSSAALSPVPANVVDQIWLWDKERTRVKFQEVFQHKCRLTNAGEYDAVMVFARDRKALVWSDPSHQLLYLDHQHMEAIQQFVREWRARVASRGS